ncbi:MAG: AAA family ATPase [Lentisphaeria bacterium]
MGAIKKITIKGFKSIRELDAFELKPLNIIVGANGSGKSNLIQIFRMLLAMTQKNFQAFITTNGGADSFPFNGLKYTPFIEIGFEFSSNSSYPERSNFYNFSLSPTVDEKFLITETRRYYNSSPKSYGPPSEESRLYDMREEEAIGKRCTGIGYFVYETISRWIVYHFHDTSANAPMRRSSGIEDVEKLRGDAGNIAAFLYHLKHQDDKESYQNIVNVVKLVIPFFEDFRLDKIKQGEAEKVKLSWKQIGSDYPMQPYHLSDGSIRFICLVTALLQPDPPSTIIIDEPELGLPPEAIGILAELLKIAATRTQVIIATQSPLLLDRFSIEDIILARRKDGASTFERLEEEDYTSWLETYSVGELWIKNVIEGGTVHE